MKDRGWNSAKLVGLLAVGALVLLAQLGDRSAAAAASDPVLIGVVLGIGSSYSEHAKSGIELALKEINDAGGVLGRPVKLIVYDDQNKPEEAAAAFERLINRDKVHILVGSVLTSTAMAQKEITRRYKRVHMAVSTKADLVRKEGHPLLFALNSSIAQDGKSFHEYVAKQLKPQKVAILAVNNDYGIGAVEAAKRDWSAPGSPKIVAVEYHEQNAPDMSAQLTKIKALGPDAIYLAQDSAEVLAKAAIQVDELGVKALKVTFPGNLTDDFIKLAGKSAEGFISGDMYLNTMATPENQAFVKNFRAMKGSSPQKMDLVGYDSLSVVLQAIAKAGTLENEAIAKVLRESAFKSPRGELKFEPLGKAFQASGGFVLTTVKEGKVMQF